MLLFKDGVESLTSSINNITKQKLNYPFNLRSLSKLHLGEEKVN